MALVTTYDPRAQATCPACNRCVSCLNVGGLMIGGNDYMRFHHPECGTVWTLYLYSGERVVENPTEEAE